VGHIDRLFRLTNEPGGLGLSCTSTGVSFAGVPLLRKVDTGFVPRPATEIENLIRAACGDNVGAAAVSRSLDAIAHALNQGDLAYAMTTAVLTRLPELDWDSAARLAKAEERLMKYDPDEPRDRHGRWTTDGEAGHPQEATTSSGEAQNGTNQSHATPILQPQKVLDLGFTPLTAEDLPAPVTIQDTQESQSPFADLESKYDGLGPVDLADRIIRFGEQLARQGRGLSPEEQSDALRQYDFFQSRMSFWLTYDGEMPPEAIANIHSAAMSLFQGAVLAGIVSPPSHYIELPHSYLSAAFAAPPAGDSTGIGGRRPPVEEDFSGESAVLDEGGRQRPDTGESSLDEDGKPTSREGEAGGNENPPDAEDSSSEAAGRTSEPDAASAESEQVGVPGGTIDNTAAKIEWDGDQGGSWEDFLQRIWPWSTRLEDGSKGFDFFTDKLSEAISAKTLNTLCVTYIRNPSSIFGRMKTYIDSAADYNKPRAWFDLDPGKIGSRTIHLAIPEYTSPVQWQYLNKAVEYGRSRNVRVVITRIR
jgi:hypothetical protein